MPLDYDFILSKSLLLLVKRASLRFVSKFLVTFILLNILLANTEAAIDLTSFEVKSKTTNGYIPVIILIKDKSTFKTFTKENTVYMLKSHTSDSQQNLTALLREEKKTGRADKIKQFWIVNAIAADLTPELIEEISNHNDIESIGLDSKYHTLEDYSTLVPKGQIDNSTSEIKHINATDMWEFGIDGSGINVSVIDTGINALHPDIAGRVIKWVDYINNRSSPYDDMGHGTHVAGIVGGNGQRGITTGVAPNVSLMIAKVCDSSGFCSDSSIVSGIQWSVENNANIISISLGGGRDPIITAAINNAIDAGVVVIASAGNSGPGAGTINFPAGEKNVIAVGAVDGSDNIASFSSRGPINVDGENLTKPDISAPAVGIVSLDRTNGYTLKSGTSMATPHVSGAVALLLQAAKKLETNLAPARIKTILENTSVDLGAPGKDNIYGAGRIDVFAAVKFLDKTAPSVIANPTSYPGGKTAAKNGERISLNATITDTGFGVKNASINVSAINASLADIILSNVSGFWINNSVTVNASDGTYYLNTTAYDNISNVNKSIRLSVTVDNTPPVIINTSGPATIEVYSGTALLAVNVTDNTSGVVRVTVNLSEIGGPSNAGMQNNTGIWQLMVNSTIVGNFTLGINASDGAGNFNTSTIRLNVTDTNPPVIDWEISSPDSIKADGVDIAILSISTHDLNKVSSIRNVTVNLTQIGGNASQEMQNNSGIWQLNISTNITGKNGSLIRLPVNVTDARNNSNTSTAILLGIKTVINISAGNQTSFNFTIGSSVFNASISIPEHTNLLEELLTAPIDIPPLNGLRSAGMALNFSNLIFNRSIRIEINYNSSSIIQNESKLRLWFYNSTRSRWEITEDSSVDIQNKTVSGNVTHLSIFAPLADIIPPSITDITVSSITENSTIITWNTDEISQSLVKYGTSSGVYSLYTFYTSYATSHSMQLTGLSAGTTYYYSINSKDQSGNSINSTEKSFTTLSGENSASGRSSSGSGGSSGGNSGGSSSGGGGGGGASSEKYTNIEVKEKYDLYISKDKITSYMFNGKGNPVLFINITGNINAGEINTAIEVLKNTSSLVKSPAPGIVYKNLNIWVGTSGFAVPKNIKEAIIQFRIENIWLNNNNNAAGSDIRMFRWDGNQWVQLETSETISDDIYTYYEAKTNAFSPFAIIGLKSNTVATAILNRSALNSPAVANPKDAAQVSIAISARQKVTPALTTRPTKEASGFESIIIILAASAIYLLLQKKK